MKLNHSAAGFLSKLLCARLNKSGTIEIIKNKKNFLENELGTLIKEYVDICAASRGRKQDDAEIMKKLGEIRSKVSSFSNDELWEVYIDKLLNLLLESENVDDVYASDEDLAGEIRKHCREFLEILEKAEEKTKSKIRNIDESSPRFASEFNTKLKQELTNLFKMY